MQERKLTYLSRSTEHLPRLQRWNSMDNFATSREKYRSFIEKNRPIGNMQASTESLHSLYGGQESQQDLSTSNSQLFTNNPPLPQTQRAVIGNNLRFPSTSFRLSDRYNGENEQLGRLMMYGDVLKHNLTTPARAGGGPPRIHFGRSGGAWRHIKQTNTHSNANFLFIDGAVRIDESFKYPRNQFVYAPMDQGQNVFISPSNPNLSELASRSVDHLTWSATEELNRRPSLSRYSNRYEQHAKENFVYWPQELSATKPKSRTHSTGTYKTWLGLSDAVLKI